MLEHLQTSGSNILKTPALYVVATPIGNLRDITLRALDVLKGVDAIAAEDTRHTRQLLDRFGIVSRTLAVHEHNENAAAQGLIDLLAQGQRIALVTDAGTPGISDPGARVVRKVSEAGYPVIPVPGSCALAAALSVAGLEEGRFLFYGFLPATAGARRSAIDALRTVNAALVFYEAPHRVRETVEDLSALEDGREIVICRELTKLHEQIARMPLADGLAWLDADSDRLRGEFVLIVSARPPEEGLSPDVERTLSVLLSELPLKQAVKLATEITGAPRNRLYERALEIKG